MTEEIKSYDEELSIAIEKLKEGVERIERSNEESRPKLLKELEKKLANAKMLYSSFLTEWRELEKKDKEIYMAKGKEYKSILDGIANKMKTIKNEVERKELGLRDDDKTTDEILAEAKQIHIASYESTERSLKIIEETKQVGVSTLEQLDEDAKKLENVEVTLGEIYDEVELAKKQLKSIARKITSGKICRGLCIIVLMGILAILIYIIVKPSKASGTPEGQRPSSSDPESTLSFM